MDPLEPPAHRATDLYDPIRVLAVDLQSLVRTARNRVPVSHSTDGDWAYFNDLMNRLDTLIQATDSSAPVGIVRAQVAEIARRLARPGVPDEVAAICFGVETLARVACTLAEREQWAAYGPEVAG